MSTILYGNLQAEIFTTRVLASSEPVLGKVRLTHTSLADLRAPSAALLGIAILLGVSEPFLLRLEK